jgi:hypothetical protein
MKILIVISSILLIVSCGLIQANAKPSQVKIGPSLARFLSEGNNFEFEIREYHKRPVIIAQTTELTSSDLIRIKSNKKITVLFLNADYQYFKFSSISDDAILEVSEWGFITQLKLERAMTGRNL